MSIATQIVIHIRASLAHYTSVYAADAESIEVAAEIAVELGLPHATREGSNPLSVGVHIPDGPLTNDHLVIGDQWQLLLAPVTRAEQEMDVRIRANLERVIHEFMKAGVSTEFMDTSFTRVEIGRYVPLNMDNLRGYLLGHNGAKIYVFHLLTNFHS